MKKNKQPDGMPVWFDGKNINEALFCDEFLQTHKIIFTNGAFCYENPSTERAQQTSPPGRQAN